MTRDNGLHPLELLILLAACAVTFLVMCSCTIQVDVHHAQVGPGHWPTTQSAADIERRVWEEFEE